MMISHQPDDECMNACMNAHDLADAAMRYHSLGRTLNGDFPLLSAAAVFVIPYTGLLFIL